LTILENPSRPDDLHDIWVEATFTYSTLRRRGADPIVKAAALE
jgi:hypothetical protein